MCFVSSSASIKITGEINSSLLSASVSDQVHCSVQQSGQGQNAIQKTKAPTLRADETDKENLPNLVNRIHTFTSADKNSTPNSHPAVLAANLDAPTPAAKAVRDDSTVREASKEPTAARIGNESKGVLKSMLDAHNMQGGAVTSDAESLRLHDTNLEAVPLEVSPMTALLDGLQGRWDREDDGMSTPSSVASMMNYKSALATPEHIIGQSALPMKTPGTVNADKFFFTPAVKSNDCADNACSASVLRREQLAAHNAVLNATVCHNQRGWEETSSDNGSIIDGGDRAESVDYFFGHDQTYASLCSNAGRFSPQRQVQRVIYSPLQPSPANSSVVSLTPSPIPQSHKQIRIV